MQPKAGLALGTTPSLHSTTIFRFASAHKRPSRTVSFLSKHRRVVALCSAPHNSKSYATAPLRPASLSFALLARTQRQVVASLPDELNFSPLLCSAPILPRTRPTSFASLHLLRFTPFGSFDPLRSTPFHSLRSNCFTPLQFLHKCPLRSAYFFHSASFR